MNLNGRKVKAPYQTKALGKVPVTYNKAGYKVVDKQTGERKFVVEQVTEEHDAWLVTFAMGHQTRFVGKRGWDDLVRMGYDKKPRLIDMETGDVVDIGGDPYDLTADTSETETIVLDD